MTIPGRDTHCPRCGTPVLAVRVSYCASPVLLDDHQLPITADLAALVPEALAWRYLGPRLGWDPLHVAARDWRPTRGMHQCPGQNNHENKHKEKHKP